MHKVKERKRNTPWLSLCSDFGGNNPVSNYLSDLSSVCFAFNTIFSPKEQSFIRSYMPALP